MTIEIIPPSPISNQQIAAAQGKIGWGKFLSAFVVTGLTTYLMNQLSLHGLNFETTDIIPGVKIPSEVIKSALDAFITAALVFLTPSHLLASFIDLIRWYKHARKQISDAYDEPTS